MQTKTSLHGNTHWFTNWGKNGLITLSEYTYTKGCSESMLQLFRCPTCCGYLDSTRSLRLVRVSSLHSRPPFIWIIHHKIRRPPTIVLSWISRETSYKASTLPFLCIPDQFYIHIAYLLMCPTATDVNPVVVTWVVQVISTGLPQQSKTYFIWFTRSKVWPTPGPRQHFTSPRDSQPMGKS